MKLYGFPPSPNTWKVRALATHLGVPLELEFVDLSKGAQYTPAYLALNPTGRTPTLVDGDFKLWESNAILQYIAGKSANALWPNDDAKKRADIARWQFWEATSLSKGTGAFAFEKLFKKIFMKQEPDPAALAAGEKDFHLFAPVLNAQLETRKWVTGDDLTLADFSVGACFSLAEASGLPWGGYGHIKAWWSRLGEIPAWKNTAPKLG